MNALNDRAGVELRDHWLRLRLDADTHADFHYVWLRHQCDHDRHPQTGERTVDPSEFAPDLRVIAAERSEAALRVRWSDARESEYPLGFLREHAYAIGREEVVPPSDSGSVERHWREFTSAEALRTAVERTLDARGLFVLRGFIPEGEVSPDDTERWIDLLSGSGLSVIGTHFGRIEDLRTDNTTNQNTDQLGYTDAPVALHTDQPFIPKPPRYQSLHCIRAAEVGGDNAVADALVAARALQAEDAEAWRLLTTVPVRFHRKQRSFESVVEAPILSYSARGFQIRYSYFTMDPFRLPFAEMEAWYRAYNRFARLVRDPRNHYSLRLNPGDILTYDNHRMVHARTGFKGARWLRGVYFNRVGD